MNLTPMEHLEIAEEALLAQDRMAVHQDKIGMSKAAMTPAERLNAHIALAVTAVTIETQRAVTASVTAEDDYPALG